MVYDNANRIKLDVFPGLTQNDSANSTRRHTKSSGYGCLRFVASSGKLAYFKYLSSGKAGVVAILAHRTGDSIRSVFRSHVAIVVCYCTEKQVIRIDARRVVARMADKHTAWYRSIVKLKREAVSKMTCVPNSKSSISICRTSLPFPTLCWAGDTNFFPKTVLWRTRLLNSSPVSNHEAVRLASDVSSFWICERADGSRFTAATFAKLFFCGYGETPIMSTDKSKGLPLFQSPAANSLFCNPCLSPASAVAISIRNFGRRVRRGMMRHVDYLLVGVERAGDVDASPGVFVSLISSILAHMSCFAQMGVTI